jgi:hypothetical protein
MSIFRYLNLKRYFGCGQCDPPVLPGDSCGNYRKLNAELKNVKRDFDILWDIRF